MSICLLLIGDGRDDYHAASRASLSEQLPTSDHVVEIDDRDHLLGFTGAVAEGWRQVLATGADWVFHAELDFTYTEPVEIDRMIAVLERHPHLTQMSLKRQPVNHEERAAGGIVELHPRDYVERHDESDIWTETKRFAFTTNPSVYSTRLCELGWPLEQHSEGVFSWRLLQADPERRCGIWGGKWDPPRVLHIGDVRAGVGY